MNPIHSLDDLQDYVAEFCSDAAIPGISVAIEVDGKTYKGAAGILNANTGVEVTTESIFQIGSITKVLTASVIMRLVDRGLVSLDQPVCDIIDGFRLKDKTLSDQITVKHLLTHTSGIPGDLFDDDSNEFGNHIKRVVDSIKDLDFVHPPGKYLTYSNTAYAVAGRVTEVILKMPWEQAIVDEIYTPLGMSSATAYPRDAIRFRTAMGHFPDGDDGSGWAVAPANFLTLGMAPAGTTLMMTASNLLKFAAAHFPGQADSDWLEPETAQSMQQQYHALPEHAPFNATGWGLGWFLSTASGQKVVGHDGATLGQVALLRVVPDTGAKIAVLVNAAKPAVLAEFYNSVAEVIGDRAVEPVEPASKPPDFDLEKYVGRYKSVGSKSQVSKNGDELALQVEWDLPMPDQHFRLRPVSAECFAAFSPTGDRELNIHFLEIGSDGRPDWLFYGLRLSRRIDQVAED